MKDKGILIRADKDLENITMELRNFDGRANAEINNIMRGVIEDESSK